MAAEHQGTSAALELSIVMPCLNEARTLGRCVGKACDFLRRHGIAGDAVPPQEVACLPDAPPE